MIGGYVPGIPGLSDIHFDQNTGHLLIISDTDNMFLETTIDGDIVKKKRCPANIRKGSPWEKMVRFSLFRMNRTERHWWNWFWNNKTEKSLFIPERLDRIQICRSPGWIHAEEEPGPRGDDDGKEDRRR